MIQITSRDKKLFDFLFKFRYATAAQLYNYLNCSYDAFRQRVYRLIREKYIESQYIEYLLDVKLYSNGITTRKNHKIKSYRKKVKVNTWTLKHHLTIIDIYLSFLNNGINENSIISERELFLSKIGLLSMRSKIEIKLPDMIIKKYSDDREKLIAIEIENHMKNKTLLRQAFKNYSYYTTYYCVRYICRTEGIKNRIIETAKEESTPFIKAYTQKEFLAGTNIFGF
jgi:hypothetical protein